MSIRTKLFLTFAEIFVLTAMVVGLYYFSAARVETYQRRTKLSREQFEAIVTISVELHQELIAVSETILAGGGPDRNALEAHQKRIAAEFRRLQELSNDAPASTGPARQLLPKLRELDHEFQRRIETITERQSAGEFAKAKAALQETLGLNLLARIDQSISSALLAENATVEDLDAQMRRTSTLAKWLLVGAVALCALFAMMELFRLVRSIGQSLRHLADGAERIARGDWETEIPLQGPDEFRRIAGTLNGMARDLRKTTVSRAYVDRILETMLDTLIVVSPEGRIQRVNPATCELLDVPADALLNEPIDRVLGGDGANEVTKTVASLVRAGVVRHAEKVYRDRAGREIPVWFSSSVMADSDGKVQGLVLVAHDITERKRAEKALRELPKRIVEAQEGERRRVSRELHDGVNQILASAKFRVQAMEEESGAEPSRHLEQARELLDTAIAEVRAISQSLRPTMLDDLGLVPSLRSLVEEFEERTGVGVTATLAELPADLGAEVELTVYRIVQEALNNVEKHSYAHRVTVDLSSVDGMLRVQLNDDGSGFDPVHIATNASAGTGMGLVNIRERVAFLAGEVTIQSVPGRGTNLDVRIPMAGTATEAKG